MEQYSGVVLWSNACVVHDAVVRSSACSDVVHIYSGVELCCAVWCM